MGIAVYALLLGVLAVYITGAGQTLAALFGGTPLSWSLIFFLVGAVGIGLGLRTIKLIELFLTIGLVTIVLVIIGFSLPNLNFVNWQYVNLAQFFFPYGVLLFAFHGTTAVPEAYNILGHRERILKKAVIIAGIFTILIYALFALAVVGVTGAETSEIATIALGQTLGYKVFVFGNLFAIVAMSTSFLMAGVALVNSLAWDLHVSKWPATMFVLLISLLIFFLGSRGFIATIDFLGSVFITLEIVLILLIAYRSKVVHT